MKQKKTFKDFLKDEKGQLDLLGNLLTILFKLWDMTPQLVKIIIGLTLLFFASGLLDNFFFYGWDTTLNISQVFNPDSGDFFSSIFNSFYYVGGNLFGDVVSSNPLGITEEEVREDIRTSDGNVLIIINHTPSVVEIIQSYNPDYRFVLCIDVFPEDKAEQDIPNYESGDDCFNLNFPYYCLDDSYGCKYDEETKTYGGEIGFFKATAMLFIMIFLLGWGVNRVFNIT